MLEQVYQLNEKFRKNAVQLSELIPSGGLMSAATTIIRSAQRINEYFVKLLKSNYGERQFNSLMDKLESNMDEIVFILDQLDISNRKKQISRINDFLKEGYNLLSIYSKNFDQVISKRISKEEM